MELVINFSGGKDSSAMLAFLCERYPRVRKHVVMADTGWEHPDAIEWSRSIVDRFDLPLHVVRNPNKTFSEMVERRGKFPAPEQRQCTSDLKRNPINTWIRRNVQDRVVVSAMGMRAQESSGRAKLKVLTRDNRETNSKRTLWKYHPILKWSEIEVRSYLAERGIPLHPVYQYLNRFSCRVCIYMGKHDLQAVQQHDPEAIDIISMLEERTGFSMKPEGTVRQLIDNKQN